MERIRVHCFIYGDVIGVGYRYWAKNQAKKLNITGWVKNCLDCVEAVFEGPEEKVKRMIVECRIGPLTGNVTTVTENAEKYTGDFKNFEILK
jgi:acylphosphatase